MLGSGGEMTAYHEKEKPVVRITEIDVIKPLPKPPVAPPPPQRIASASYTNLRMVKETDPDREIPPITEVQKLSIGATNQEGAIVPEIQVVSSPPSATETQAANKEPEIDFEPVEKGPEFPGGKNAWANFLNRYLQTPADLSPGEKKVVLISFLVDADGTVTGFKVLQSGGDVFDNEVVRVLKKMPKWKPAVQNGHAVAVPFTQPVTFVGVEQ